MTGNLSIELMIFYRFVHVVTAWQLQGTLKKFSLLKQSPLLHRALIAFRPHTMSFWSIPRTKFQCKQSMVCVSLQWLGLGYSSGYYAIAWSCVTNLIQWYSCLDPHYYLVNLKQHIAKLLCRVGKSPECLMMPHKWTLCNNLCLPAGQSAPRQQSTPDLQVSQYERAEFRNWIDNWTGQDTVSLWAMKWPLRAILGSMYIICKPEFTIWNCDAL